MKCSLIRDLLPLYVEGDCCPETNKVVREHLGSCSECRELYELMKSPIDVKAMAQPVTTETHTRSNEFWKKYYGRLILKGAGWFFVVYAIVVVIMLILNMS
ncbi:anti-sigma factor family protein [Alkalihalobacterium elongatum]|uniref:anti-sigma factor family protein n=1 Tax=Alkalihalobacterium elongatum TaxID=2675466 RepID=UPI001C1FE6C6|nr:zf-HC2 domain-containing protein [Alkalihalobacterium elongatum]